MLVRRSASGVCSACRRAAYIQGTPILATSSTSSALSIRPSSEPAPKHTPVRKRTYATVQDDRHTISQWPKASHPTPYEVLNIRAGEPYTKRRFYELVKLYHPDKHEHSAALDQIPVAARTERYRLIVAANDLLSDPSKRRLYDDHGVGWTAGRAPDIHDSMRHADHAWREQPNNPAGNGTWEDWERWHERRQGKHQEPMYMSNGTFATLVVGLCMIGAFVQMYRADNMGAQYVEYRAQRNSAIADEVRRSTLAASGRSREKRVDEFLKDRETAVDELLPTSYEAPPPDRS